MKVTLNGNKENIKQTLWDAPDHTKREGREWYDTAYQYADALTPGNPQIGAGVIAALSPQMDWEHNLELATQFIDWHDTDGQTQTQKNKATRIVARENPLAVLHGPKERAFYLAILSRGLNRSPACIDRHAFSIYAGRVLPEVELKRVGGSKPVVLQVQKAYANAADELDVPRHILQAITWVHWRNTN